VEVGLSLGSNLGDRLANLRAARARIAALPGVRIAAAAPVYETEPVGVKPEHRHLSFLNTVLVLDANLPVEDLHLALAAIESDLGRVREGDRYAPRRIDIDVLYGGPAVRPDAELTLPHPRWSARRFVVQPLADVRPDLVLPGAAASVREVLASLPPAESVALFATDW
jgi:2-amino-4-hydroxy-6-hydroxymethyldihydropteridine diphosphokinase